MSTLRELRQAYENDPKPSNAHAYIEMLEEMAAKVQILPVEWAAYADHMQQQGDDVAASATQACVTDLETALWGSDEDD